MEKNKIREIMLRIDMERREILKPQFLKIGLTIGQGQPRILNYLKKYGAMTQRELADLCCIDVTTISRTLDKMEEKGLLERRKDPSCRRSHQIVLAEEGLRRASQVQDIFQDIDEQIWKGFSEEEMETLYEGLVKMEENLKKV
ncbi:MarR family winged helix-turn-helix transcriptional regulator [Sellimonas caecigallum]|uniref:MarR family transcriptional regulator n=1 Tax=Sellimonas caecigallum TaxID=2592333 RepID=A0ABS7L5D6_9FIRM|nr:MarR family transcriptional regulator [Sellimonas caecigallum]MBY0758239.1 MarR family transcriptional regulator [Sellimonas caecigallum]